MLDRLLPMRPSSRGSTLVPLVLALVLAFVLAPAALVAGVSPAAAQTTMVVPGGYITFTPAQREYIEGYVARHPVPPAPIPGGFAAAVGAVVPPGVALRRFGPAPGYGYARPGYGVAGYGAVYDQGYDQAYDAEAYGLAGDGVYGQDYGSGYGQNYGQDYGLSGYRYVVLPGNEAAVVEPRSRRIILIVE